MIQTKIRILIFLCPTPASSPGSRVAQPGWQGIVKAIPGSKKTFPVEGLAGSLWGWDGKSGSNRKAYIAGALWRPRGGSRFGITEAEGSHCQVWQPDLTSGALSPQVLIPSPLRRKGQDASFHSLLELCSLYLAWLFAEHTNVLLMSGFLDSL